MSSITVRLTALAAAGLTVVAVAGAAPTSYLDPSGDNGTSADIGAVSAELASDGYLHVKATIANLPALQTPGNVLLALDTDRSGSTGAIAGADYLVLADLSDLSGIFVKWNGSGYGEAPTQAGDVRYLLGGGAVEFLVRPAALGGATSFNFIVGATTGSGDGSQVDVAPDNGTWFFEVPPPPPPPPAPPAVARSASATFSPAVPRAGRMFRVSRAALRLSDGSTAAAESYRCRATLAGKVMRGTGVGGCAFAVPKTAKGKRLAVTVSATYGGRTLSTAQRAFVVR